MVISCCRQSEMENTTIDAAERLVLSNPDSAFQLLQTIAPSKIKGSYELARFGLLHTVAEDKLGIVHKSEENIDRAVDYYEMHPASDSLLGVVFYYLGRVQEDLEEPHKALESYFKSKSCFESCNSPIS